MIGIPWGFGFEDAVDDLARQRIKGTQLPAHEKSKVPVLYARVKEGWVVVLGFGIVPIFLWIVDIGKLTEFYELGVPKNRTVKIENTRGHHYIVMEGGQEIHLVQFGDFNDRNGRYYEVGDVLEKKEESYILKKNGRIILDETFLDSALIKPFRITLTIFITLVALYGIFFLVVRHYSLDSDSDRNDSGGTSVEKKSAPPPQGVRTRSWSG